MFAFPSANNSSVTSAGRHSRASASRGRTSAFTLVELLITISIISILASMILVAMFGAQEDAKIARTETQIAKIHELIMGKWEEYETRPVPVDFNANNANSPLSAARLRLIGLRELQRCELPERITDVFDPPVVLKNNIAPLQGAYQRQALASVKDNDITNWTDQFQGSECLYMIISKMRSNGRSAIEFFNENEIGDTDGDQMPEVLDAWGKPIEFLRWAPGYIGLPHSALQPAVPAQSFDGVIGDLNTDADGDAGSVGDPFDFVRADPRWRDYDATTALPSYKENEPFALYPLIFSAGPDDAYDILLNDTDNSNNAFDVHYSQTANAPYFPYSYGQWQSYPGPGMPNDPYIPLPNVSQGADKPVFMGRPSLSRDGYLDNISNHTLTVN